MTKIYLDNAASTPMNPEVFDHMKPYFCDLSGNPSSTHAHGRELRAAIEQSRRTIADLIGASPAEIVFTSGGTEADNAAICGAVKGFGLTHVISTEIEHHAVTHTIELLEKEGLITVTWLPVDDKGSVKLADLRTALANNPRSLVTLMHGNNELGTLNDLEAIGNLCVEYDALFHSDTVQTMGHIAYDLKNLPIHFLSASAHKFYGPKGVGFLYVKRSNKIPAHIQGGSQERNMRAGTENVPAIAGMAFALKKCYADLDGKNGQLRALKSYMMEQLQAQIPGIQFNGDTSAEGSLPTVLNVAPPCGEGDAMLIFNLDLVGISASGGSACNSGANLGSHVLRAIGCDPSRARNSIRFSFGMQNTKAEIDYAVEKLKEIVQTLQPVQ